MVQSTGYQRGGLVASRHSTLSSEPAEEGLFPIRLSTPIALQPIGKDVSLMGIAEDGGFYYCKNDSRQVLTRATEVAFTVLADHLGFSTAKFRCIKDMAGNTYFGSFKHPSTASEEDVRSFFMREATNEFGGPSGHKAAFIARLFTYDRFIGNSDRVMRNVIAINDRGIRRIAPIDFAEADLLRSPTSASVVETSNTRRWQRVLESTHGFAHEASREMLARIAAVPSGFFETVFDRMPPGWIDASQRQSFLEFWSGQRRQDRLAAIGASLKDGSHC